MSQNIRYIPLIFLILNLLNPLFPGSTSAQSIHLLHEYLSFVQQKINSYLIYPLEAETKGWEGIVKVKLTIVKDGRIKEVDVAESSGYPLLDAAAILAIKDASPYPFPKDYQEEELEVTLPVNYVQFKTTPLPAPEKSLPLPRSLSTTELEQEALVQSEDKKESLFTRQQLDKPRVPVTGTQELSYFIELALKNNQPAQVAREEVELAEIKVIEAQRGFFPSFKALGYNTEGEVYKIDTEEREFKALLSQPLYYGGLLRNTLKQARVNLEITQRNYDRLKLDVMQKTEVAYYNLLGGKTNLQQKEEFYKEAEDLLEKIEKLAKVEMLTPLEIASAKTLFEQIGLQVKSVEQDLLMAELTFKQVVNIKEVPQTESQLPEAKRLDLQLLNCLEPALNHRPEAYLSELLVRFNDYGKKIESSKLNAFTVDLTSSYGYYQGHYKTEPWGSSDNWYAGVKISKPWGGSSLNTSYTQGSSGPTFGQTTPTASSTISAEFNLLDNIKRLSDKKRSDIDLLRSLSDFNETTKTIAFEVQDAFLNYQKAILQLQTAQAEMKFRRNEAEVIKTRTQVGEASLSSLMESLYNFGETQTKHTQAIINYHISLANLKKACGYGLKI